MTLSNACRTGLVLISHGSPSQPWNMTMERVSDSVKRVLGGRTYNPFKRIQLAHLEFANPNIADTCDSFEAENCDRIIAYPLFISVSSHSERDIPNALNIRYHDYSDPEIRRYTGKLPVTYTAPMDHGPILPRMVAECAEEISKDPSNETALILSHGGGCEHFWEHMHRRVAHEITETTGIQTVSWLAVQTGRSPESQDRLVNAVDEIRRKDPSRRILILSCFGGLSGAQFIERVNGGLIKRNKPELKDLVGCTGWINRAPVIEEIANVVQRAAAAANGVQLEDQTNILHPKDQHPPYNPPFWLTRDHPDRKNTKSH
jgi:sirohydrochlorin ferrochelatase